MMIFIWFPCWMTILSSVYQLPTVTQALTLDTQCGLVELKMYPSRNRVLGRFTYKNKTAPNAVICARDCSIEQDCKSFNFFKCKNLCEFNNCTRFDSSGAFLEIQGAVYFDGDEDTPLFSLPDDPAKRYGSCKELKEAGYYSSGVFKIWPTEFCDGLDVYCDMDTDGGGWIVYQRRQDGSVDFYRTWAEYQSGFGDLSGEHWLGNDNLVRLTSDPTRGPWDLRVDLTDWSDSEAFAIYSKFRVSGEYYRLDYDEYDARSTAGDSLDEHRGRLFTTKDSDHDSSSGNCADYVEGGWWFKGCLQAHLNGVYDRYAENGNGIVWHDWHGNYEPLKASSMKIRQL